MIRWLKCHVLKVHDFDYGDPIDLHDHGRIGMVGHCKYCPAIDYVESL